MHDCSERCRSGGGAHFENIQPFGFPSIVRGTTVGRPRRPCPAPHDFSVEQLVLVASPVRLIAAIARDCPTAAEQVNHRAPDVAVPAQITAAELGFWSNVGFFDFATHGLLTYYSVRGHFLHTSACNRDRG